jgi:very-short-patch-repair endonuclease
MFEGRQPQPGSATTFGRCTARELSAYVRGCTVHSIQMLAGVDTDTLRDQLAAEADVGDETSARPVVFMNISGTRRTEAMIDRAITHLASVAGDLWPLWFGGEDFSQLGDDALSHMYLPIRLSALASRRPELSTGWAAAAIKQILRGRMPRVPAAAPETEWQQLCHAISPAGLIVIVPLEAPSPDQGWPCVHALEWLAAKGNVAMTVVCRDLPPRAPPFDRLLYGACVMTGPEGEPAQSGIPSRDDRDEDRPADPDRPEIVLPPVFGRPHPLSPIEQRLSRMINADAELAPKFIFNARVSDVSLKSPRVDLLWTEGRLVIEFDGAEHRGRRAYREDRHRDYELMCAGYLVLRITNDEIIEDHARAIEKIRSVVRLRGSLEGGPR